MRALAMGVLRPVQSFRVQIIIGRVRTPLCRGQLYSQAAQEFRDVPDAAGQFWVVLFQAFYGTGQTRSNFFSVGNGSLAGELQKDFNVVVELQQQSSVFQIHIFEIPTRCMNRQEQSSNAVFVHAGILTY